MAARTIFFTSKVQLFYLEQQGFILLPLRLAPRKSVIDSSTIPVMLSTIRPVLLSFLVKTIVCINFFLSPSLHRIHEEHLKGKSETYFLGNIVSTSCSPDHSISERLNYSRPASSDNRIAI